MTTENLISPAVGVYLSAQMGNEPEFKQAAIQLGQGLAKLGITLVYGGASVGLMGLLAETVKSHGGKVIGIITEQLIDKEKPFPDLDELYIVQSMYERKRLIHEKSSGFLVMPGGLGTFDELFETWCSIKLGLIPKPFGIINICGYFDSLFEFLNHSKNQGFLGESHLAIPTTYASVSACLADLEKVLAIKKQTRDLEVEPL